MSSARRGVRVALVVIFALLALNAWAQVALVAFGDSYDPPLLIALQVLIGLTAALAAAGIWRGARWAPAAALAYGLVTGGMLVALEFILDLDRDARGGLWMGAMMVVLFAALAAWYLSRSLAREAAATDYRPPPDRSS